MYLGTNGVGTNRFPAGRSVKRNQISLAEFYQPVVVFRAAKGQHCFLWVIINKGQPIQQFKPLQFILPAIEPEGG